MSVRRLAEDQFQPTGFSFNEENAIWAEATIAKYPEGRQQSAVIPLLMRAQEQDGWVTRAAIEFVADKLAMPYIRVLEVATFYTQFQLKPVGTRAHVQVCGTTPCMLRGAEDLINVCKKKIHQDPFELNADGTLSWEEVECQGACVNAPMVMIFKDSYEDLTPTQLEHIIDRFEAGKGSDITPGPQIDRVYSAPVGGPTTLIEVEGKTSPKSAKPATNDVKETVAEAPVVEKATASAQPALDDKNRPSAVEKPATPDDLKMISGVGPKIEGILNGLGIYTFAQVAGWKKAEREWVDGYLKFAGRIERDDWVKQAKALAKGGEAEYIKVFGKKPR
ncbi:MULTISPECIES: NADH-quinone oxidoreductase subunit NuoE [Alphaproteobacteria]|uniref:NADH dehydrogenase subunit E n=2 Tax=Alphaproteobacteria TaxID=28211 RepID=A0A512HLR3_9HYPH|nr:MULTISPECIES: NADH-quinone oxidoreductase subunit NuoE [Alphaproteobacteria]GEO86381.1 NADH dehydrogenase subunit E [Ciceribacter naphthalenivorans]GLR22259.1 NADH dehydrogenase subunit E [Ciceribacter naphthalenivorans]GLT05115.1 NADH dehydrogenase subunit E [Sphingomonas psychrolutea]